MPPTGSPPLLALPSSIEVLGPAEGSWRSLLHWRTWMRFWIGVLFRRGKPRKRTKRNGTGIQTQDHSGLGLKILRSSLLIIKVWTIPRICPDPLTRLRAFVAAVLLAAALADTVIDYDARSPQKRGQNGQRRQGITVRSRGLWVTLALALFHFAVLAFGSWAERSGLGGYWGGNMVCASLRDGLPDITPGF